MARRTSIGKKLLWSVALPSLVVSVAGVSFFWTKAARLVAHEPRLEQQVAEIFESAMTSVLLFGGLIACATAVSLQLFLRRPLAQLVAVMRRAQDGDFLVRAEARSNDEIGELSRAFNQMLARITALKAEGIDTHRDLEVAHEELRLKQALQQTNNKLERRLTELSLLYDMARQLTSTIELPELLSQITALVAERLGIRQFSIMLASEGKLEVKSSFPKGQSEGLQFDFGEGACGTAASTLTAVYLRDLEQDATVYVNRRRGTAPRGSLLCLPMVHKGSVLGVLNFQRPEPNAFTDEERELLAAVADQAAVAVKNALLHEQTVALSITDPLTETFNRRHLFTRLEMELARAGRFSMPMSVLMIDIDHFKHLNDLHGHRAGDFVLRRVADILGTSVRKVDTLARYGGEEFMVLLPQVDKAEAAEVGEKLRLLVEQSDFIYGPSQPGGRVTISVGVATFPSDATELEPLVDTADSALYASKRGGRNLSTSYAPGMELHPGRERGPYAARRRTGEIAVLKEAVRPTS